MNFQLTLNNFIITDKKVLDVQNSELLFEIEFQEEAPYVKKQILNFSSNDSRLINILNINSTIYNWIFSLDDLVYFEKYHTLCSTCRIKDNIFVLSPVKKVFYGKEFNEEYILSVEEYFNQLFFNQDIQLFKYLESIKNRYDKNLRQQLRIKLSLAEYLRNNYLNKEAI
jgi:hypothetical protein